MNSKNSFMGISYPYEQSKVVFLSAPYEATSTYLKGQASGPSAILDASAQVETYDIDLDSDFIDKIAPHVLSELKIQKLEPKKAIDAVASACSKVFDDNKFPLTLGGEHSISLGPIISANSHFEDLCVLHLDAHADMRDEFHGSKYNHGCVIARARELVPVVSVGVRSYCSDESKIIKKNYSDVVFGPQLDSNIIDKIISKINEKNVYITIDVDGFDPAIMPATGTPEPGGLLWYETLALLKKVSKKKNVVGADIVELAPRKDDVVSDFACAKLAYKLCGYCLLK